jgi:cobalt-zinc-cadmium efflux system membrane fusion protein
MIRPLFTSSSLLALACALQPGLAAADHADHDHAGHDHGGHEHPVTVRPAPAPAPVAPAAHAEHAGHADHDAHQDAGDESAEGHHEQVVIPSTQLATFGIALAPVGVEHLAEPVLAPGWVTYDPAGEYQVGVATPGRVVRIVVSVGATVAAGDVLAEVLSPGFVEAQNEWLVKRTAVSTAHLAVAQAQAAVERGRQSGDGLSKAEQQRREFTVQQAQQEVVVAETAFAAALNTLRLLAGEEFDVAALATQQIARQTLTLHAPAAGVVIDVGAVRGQQVSPDGQPLVTVADPARLWVVAQIPETLLAQVAVGSQVTVTGFAGTRLASGTVSHLTPEIDPHTRTGRARISVEAAVGLRPGMYVQSAIVPRHDEAHAPVLAVPESALQPFEGNTVVFVAQAQGDATVFRPRPLVLGPIQGGKAPVLSGLEAGEVIAVQGAFLLAADLGKEGAAHEH